MRERTGFFVRRSNPFATILAFVFSLILLLIVLIPIIAFGVLILLWVIVRALFGFIFGLFGRTTQPNGVLDGRRNVRVRMPTDQSES